MGWEEYIVLYMARKALEKEESDSGPIQRQMAEMRAEIEEAAWTHVMSEVPAVRNSDRTHDYMPSREYWAWL
jgi:hypothetical protein